MSSLTPSSSNYSTVFLQGRHDQLKEKFRGHYISPERKGTPLEAIHGYKNNGGDPNKIERTNAVYYTSSIYPNALTPEFILGHKHGEPLLPGQIPSRFNKWSPFEAWHMVVNYYHHKRNDVQPAILFGNTWIHNTLPDREPRHVPTPTYEDNIMGQVAGAACAGLQVGTVMGISNCVNLAKEAGLFQSAWMPQNRWLPIGKATIGFRMRIMGSCMFQNCIFWSAFAFVDGTSSQLRQKDDFWNCIFGGLASAAVHYSWHQKNSSLIFGLAFGSLFAFARYGWSPEGTPKLALDIDRPFYGVFGGPQMWFFGHEPVGNMFYSLFSQKNRMGYGWFL